MAAELQPDAQTKKLRRRRAVLLLCIVLLLGGIGAEGFFLIRRAENSILTVQRDPAGELLDAVQRGDYDSARLIRLTDFPDGDVPERVTEKLKAQAQAIRDAYFAEQTDAESAKALLQTLTDLDIAAVTETAKPLSEDVQLHEMWLKMIQKANASCRSGDYEAALKQYRKIPKKDQSLRRYYETQLAQCKEHLRAETAEQIAAAEAEGDYDTAVSLAEHIRGLDDDNKDQWDETLAGIKARQQQAQYSDACQKARNCYDAGDYAAAFDALRSLPDAVRETYPVDDTLQSYRDSYFRILPVTVGNLLGDGDTAKAEQLAAEAQALFPDAAEPAAMLEQIRLAVPKELIAFGEPALSDFTAADTELTGSDGKTYQSETGNLYCSYDGVLSGRKSCTAEFRIGDGYRRLTLIAVPLKGFDPDATVLLEIGDGRKELKTYAITKKGGALHIDLDISGAESLRLCIQPAAGAEDLRNAGVIIADACVRS